jgi:UDP-3-O-[3-hydroxymyristoyl] glucosamine N-acyltransferase
LAVIAIVALLRTAWETNWGDIQGKTAAVMAFIQAVIPVAMEYVQGVISSALAAIATFWETYGAQITATATSLWDSITTVVKAAVDFLLVVIPAFLDLAKQGRIGAVVLDEGDWRDLGDPAAYLAAHRELALASAVHPEAVIDPTATVERSVIGPRAEVGAGAVVKDSVVWPSGKVAAGQMVEGRIVTG